MPSVCPYCSVGCGQIVMVNDAGKIIDIQGNPDSPISFGTLCPKGAATYQLGVNDLRWTKVKYRAPGGDHWEDKPLDWTMNRIAELVKKTRDDNFNEFRDVADVTGKSSRKRLNEHIRHRLPRRRDYRQRVELYLAKTDAWTGLVAVENQARI